jgi:hypothetical protein
MAPMEPRVNEDALSSACFARRCSSSWGLVARRHRWPLAPREQMGIGHVKGAERSGDGVPVATHCCVGGVWWTGGHPTRPCLNDTNVNDKVNKWLMTIIAHVIILVFL